MKSGSVKIKNVSGGSYSFEELGGHTVDDQVTVDLTDTSLPVFYEDWDAARSAALEITTTKLYQDIQSGLLEVVECTPPFNRGLIL